MDNILPTITLRLVAALFFGIIIGWEREYNEHNAGIRTNALVALGTALLTVVSGYGFLEFTSYPHVQIDPTRIASYITAGIGFIGGGVIFLRQDQHKVKGLTTAACIWLIAAVGMACGAGMFAVAALATLLSLVILIGVRLLETKLLMRGTPSIQVITITTKEEITGQLIERIYDILAQAKIEIERVEFHTDATQTGTTRLKIECRSGNNQQLLQSSSSIQQLPEILSVQTTIDKSISTGIQREKQQVK
ncbi:MAG TPA: MgtC/SapB family protein [Dictyobacter sp.]|nr:MgtC/SapB family protein [Dictyobacter sp.]